VKVAIAASPLIQSVCEYSEHGLEYPSGTEWMARTRGVQAIRTLGASAAHLHGALVGHGHDARRGSVAVGDAAPARTLRTDADNDLCAGLGE